MSCSGPEEILSVAWTQRLIEVFLSLQEQFHGLVLKVPSPRSTAVDRTLNEYYDRSVKALDVCNAVRDGIEQVRSWGKLLEIVLARKALVDLSICTLDGKDSGPLSSHWNRSFARSNNSSNPTTPRDYRSAGHFRSLSWSVSRAWSAARQIQAIGCNLNYPRGNEIGATHGLSLAVYTMGVVLLFVMWALVAAIPCQDRALQAHFAVPRQIVWAGPLLTLQDRIMEE
ncbi:hypothetical protein SAY86_013111 [Trapa natans]|uniref:Uncharacterized protein n=1 Tax=Trapa natans TaxID=22666 RepID=A0AAN7LZ47_TRANT|nr:hypothetical protein SAY86_013111 [Trapa natans]